MVNRKRETHGRLHFLGLPVQSGFVNRPEHRSAEYFFNAPIHCSVSIVRATLQNGRVGGGNCEEILSVPIHINNSYSG